MSEYEFSREMLDPALRQPGISAFMRIKNGEDFLEQTILSHLPYFDEIVAVYNQCTDGTEAILLDLQQRYPDKIRVFHYEPRVYPVGSEEHRNTPGDSINSIVNYYNYALAKTRFTVATKLDDDHIAIERNLAPVVNEIRSNGLNGEMRCFSGLNLALDKQGHLGILPFAPYSGGGDIGFFEVSEETYFHHDRRFERFHRGGRKRVFAGFLYWHMKALKPNYGFANYELDRNPNSRYHKMLALRIENAHVRSLSGFKCSQTRFSWKRAISELTRYVDEKRALAHQRRLALCEGVLESDFNEVERVVDSYLERGMSSGN